MFSILKRKKEKKLEDNSVEINSDNYKMQERYKSDNLVIGNLEHVSSKVTPFGPMVKQSTQKYIFEKINENGKTRYREIFAGFIADGICNLNCDTNGDGKPDNNIDLDGDGKCDLNCDTDGEGYVRYFDIPYVVNIVPLKDKIPTIPEDFHKYCLLQILDEINEKRLVRKIKR